MSASPPVSGAPNQISWNGQLINFKIQVGTKDVTDERDWRTYAQLLYTRALQLNPAESAKKAEIVIDGNFASISEAAPTVNPFQGCSLKQVTIEDTVLADAGRIAHITSILNELGSHSADVFPQAAPIRSSIPRPTSNIHSHLTDVSGGGRCGPASIVHQMRIRAPSWNNPHAEQLLREAAAHNMELNPYLRNDREFQLHIFQAIRELHTRQLITEPGIAAIIAKHASSHHTAETIVALDQAEMETLINHYASRIKQNDFWIDFAFIFALKYPLPDGEIKNQLPAEFQNGIPMVVFQGEHHLNVMHNTSLDLFAANTLYIWFNGTDHYKSVKHDSTELRPALERFWQQESIAQQQLEVVKARNAIVGHLRHFANFDMAAASLENRAAAVQGLIPLLQQLQLLDGKAFNEYMQFLSNLNHGCTTVEQLIAWQAQNLPGIQAYLNIYLRAVYPPQPAPSLPGTPEPTPHGFATMSTAQLLQVDSTHMDRDTKEALLNHILDRLYKANPQNLVVYWGRLIDSASKMSNINVGIQKDLLDLQINHIHVIQGLIRQQLGI